MRGGSNRLPPALGGGGRRETWRRVGSAAPRPSAAAGAAPSGVGVRGNLALLLVVRIFRPLVGIRSAPSPSYGRTVGFRIAFRGTVDPTWHRDTRVGVLVRRVLQSIPRTAAGEAKRTRRSGSRPSSSSAAATTTAARATGVTVVREVEQGSSRSGWDGKERALSICGQSRSKASFRQR